MRKLVFITILSITFSYNNSSSNERTVAEQVVKADSVKRIDTVVKDDNDLSKKLIGAWALSGSENATFEITKTTFYYPEHLSSYKYKS
jgi:hypothetical protein